MDPFLGASSSSEGISNGPTSGTAVRPEPQPQCRLCGDLEEAEDSEEAVASKGINCGIKPSERDVEEHERNHLPFRNWCKHCVFGRAKNNPHKATDREEYGIAKISMDYMYLNEERAPGVPRPAEVQGEGLPILVSLDSNTKAIFANAVPNKGECEYATRRAAQDYGKLLGYKKFIIKGDQEPALRTLIDRVGMSCGNKSCRKSLQ